MGRDQCLVVQPWFPDPGHPAVSLANLCRVLPASLSPSILVYVPRGDLAPNLSKIIKDCRAETVTAPRFLHQLLKTLGCGTLACAFAIHRRFRDGTHKIFFVDANIYVLSGVLLLLPWKVDSLGVQLLKGPEFYRRDFAGRWFKWPLVKRFLRSWKHYLFFRTPELTASWRTELPQYGERLRYLPSIDLVGRKPTSRPPRTSSVRQFLVAGQIRSEKSVATLIKIFRDSEGLGELALCGVVVDPELRTLLTARIPHVITYDRYLSEEDMQHFFLKSDYNLMLYHPWDARMESAVLFRSIQFSCPVVCYAGGWLGSNVVESGLGWTIPRTERGRLKEFLMDLPEPGSNEYQAVIENLYCECERQSNPSRVSDYLRTLGWS